MQWYTGAGKHAWKVIVKTSVPTCLAGEMTTINFPDGGIHYGDGLFLPFGFLDFHGFSKTVSEEVLWI